MERGGMERGGMNLGGMDLGGMVCSGGMNHNGIADSCITLKHNFVLLNCSLDNLLVCKPKMIAITKVEL